MARRRFNWIAAIVLVIALVVLAVTAFGLRQWQRKRMAYTAREAGLKAYENHIWEDAASQLGRYIAVHPGDIQILLKYADAQLNIRPLKRNNIQQAISAYRSVFRIDKNNPTAAEKLVNIYLQMNIAAEAELIAERYLQTNEGDALEKVPIRRALTNKEVAETILFFLSDSAGGFNAVEIPMDGGLTAGK